MQSRRLGEFQIPYEWIEKCPEHVRDIMGRCIILKAEDFYFIGKYIEYIAESPLFDEVPEGEGVIPYSFYCAFEFEEGKPEKWECFNWKFIKDPVNTIKFHIKEKLDASLDS